MDKDIPLPIQVLELYAYVGLDENGSGAYGLKQGLVPAGLIALVAIDRDKVETWLPQLEQQAKRYGKKIRLCRFVFAEVVHETEHGHD